MLPRAGAEPVQEGAFETLEFSYEPLLKVCVKTGHRASKISYKFYAQSPRKARNTRGFSLTGGVFKRKM
jgi:hypothetical protein